MLRSLLLHASTSSPTPPFLRSLRPRTNQCRTLTFFRTTHKANHRKGRMCDVLEILGDCLFPLPCLDFYMGVLRRCIRRGDSAVGMSVHGSMVKFGIVAEPLVSNVLLDLYGKTGLLDDCLKLFEEMPDRDVVSWCTLISGFVRHGFDLEAFILFKEILWSGPRPNRFVVSSVLKGCAASGVAQLGLQVHGLIIKTGLSFDRYVDSGLVDMYTKCGGVADALKLFYEIPVKNLVSWNAMISGYVQSGFLVDAMKLCLEMCRAGFVMDLVTTRVVASAAASLGSFEVCKNLHAYSIKIGFDADSFVVAEFVRLLAKLGDVEYIGELFAAVRKPEVSLFSLLISGYHANNCRVEAVRLTEELLRLDLNLNEGVLVNVLNLCICKEEGTQVHSCFLKSGHGPYIHVGNALISMYTKFGMMKDANAIFHEMPIRDVVSWTVIMAGHVQSLRFLEALQIFRALRETGINLDQYPIATALHACSGLRAINEGKQIHAMALKLIFGFSDFLKVTLLHMYAKCSLIDCAIKLFSNMTSPHGLVSINVMMAAYCWNLQPDKALEFFCREYQMGLIPDKFIFSTVMGACTSLRRTEMGQQVHSLIIKSGFEVSDPVVVKSVLKFYTKCGNVKGALKFFQSWHSNARKSVVKSEDLHNGNYWEALKLLHQMHQIGFIDDFTALSSSIKVCTDLNNFEVGKQIHAAIVKMGYSSDKYIENVLVEMHAKCEHANESMSIYNGLTVKGDPLLDLTVTKSLHDGKKKNGLKVTRDTKPEKAFQEDFDYLTVFSFYAMTIDLVHETFFHELAVRRCLETGVLDRHRNFNIGKDSLNLFSKVVTKDAIPLVSVLPGYHEHVLVGTV